MRGEVSAVAEKRGRSGVGGVGGAEREIGIRRKIP